MFNNIPDMIVGDKLCFLDLNGKLIVVEKLDHYFEIRKLDSGYKTVLTEHCASSEATIKLLQLFEAVTPVQYSVSRAS